MTRSTDFSVSKPSLNGKVFCANCDAEMANTGQRYYCPNNAADSDSNCLSKPVSAHNLNRVVISTMVERLVNEDTVRRITESIKDATEVNLHTQRWRMERAEEQIAEINNTRRPAILHPVEHGIKTYDDVVEDISLLDQHTAALAFESMVARDELDKIAWLRDEDGIKEDISNPESYLQEELADEAQELLDLLIRKVVVDSRSTSDSTKGRGIAAIFYEVAMPTPNYPEGIEHELVIFDIGDSR